MSKEPNMHQMTDDEFQQWLDEQAAALQSEQAEIEERSKTLTQAQRSRATVERLQREIRNIETDATGARELVSKVDKLRDALVVKALRTLSRANIDVEAILRANEGNPDPGAEPNSSMVGQLETVTKRLREKVTPVSQMLDLLEDLGPRLDDAVAGAIEERTAELSKLAPAPEGKT